MKKRLNTYVVIDKREFSSANLVYQDLYACTSNEPPTRLEEPGKSLSSIRCARNLTCKQSAKSGRSR